MVRLVTVLFFFAALTVARCTTWAWMSAADYLRTSTLIAVIDVGDVHEVFTPEGIMVRSATARIVKKVYWQFERDMPLPEAIVIYDTDPNAITDSVPPVSNSQWQEFKRGRAFAILEMRGDMKFRPYDRLSLQYLKNDDRAMWPVPPHGTESMSIDKINAEIQNILDKNKNS
ncbi:MAG: hypothetical protein ACOYM3_27840 [Terrimicrobiaceae bacterium]